MASIVHDVLSILNTVNGILSKLPGCFGLVIFNAKSFRLGKTRNDFRLSNFNDYWSNDDFNCMASPHFLTNGKLHLEEVSQTNYSLHNSSGEGGHEERCGK